VRRLVAILPALLVACGGAKGFTGTFTGTYQGKPVTLFLEVAGPNASGTMEWGGVEGIVAATIDGNRLKGAVRQPQMGVEVPFDATLDGDTIDWTYMYVVAGEKVPLKLTRTKEVPPKGQIDQQLVGRWRAADGGTTCVLAADGTFERGAERGRWMTEGAILHTRAVGAGWAVWGRYVLSGAELTIYDRDGAKQVWKRG
jgi:hypothetical protein